MNNRKRNKNLEQAYRDAVIYFIDPPPKEKSFYVITAFNPRSLKILDDESNQIANKKLLRKLNLLKPQAVGQCISSDAVGNWKEESYWVVGLTEEEVLDMVREFNQNAVYYFDYKHTRKVIWLQYDAD